MHHLTISVPSAPVIYAVVPIYNQLSELNEVIVQWEEVVCKFNFVYTLNLT